MEAAVSLQFSSTLQRSRHDKKIVECRVLHKALQSSRPAPRKENRGARQHAGFALLCITLPNIPLLRWRDAVIILLQRRQFPCALANEQETHGCHLIQGGSSQEGD